ncbi:MAG: hypothetical protein U0Y08_04505 [Bacteroidia bacterium]
MIHLIEDILELNPIIASIIEIKKKIFIKLKKLGIIDESFEDLNSQYENIKDELNAETKRDIPDLSKSAAEELKEYITKRLLTLSPGFWQMYI